MSIAQDLRQSSRLGLLTGAAAIGVIHGLDRTGALVPGYRADLVVLAARLHVTDVMHGGRWLAAPNNTATHLSPPGEQHPAASRR